MSETGSAYDPIITLAVDNCFASKRWIEPAEWMQIAADAGIRAVEASADTECDPLYTPPDALRAWLDKVAEASARTGVRVANFYSGHGTYATLGLTHTDPRVRDHIQHNWLDVMIANAAGLGAGLGFFCHAFSQATLADPRHYAELESDLFRRLAELAQTAARVGLPTLSVEQMYSPHQPPWTINGSLRLLREVQKRGGQPLYLTLDVGHQVGQRHYLRPGRVEIGVYVMALRQGKHVPDLWLGGAETADWLSEPDAAQRLMAYVEERPYLFAASEDGDLYEWARVLGGYSPIVHLQQTDGSSSGHQPFNAKTNANGIVLPEKVLRALQSAYAAAPQEGAPPRVREIVLTIEVFAKTAERPAQTIQNIRETADYWRRFVPEDGLSLSTLVASL